MTSAEFPKLSRAFAVFVFFASFLVACAQPPVQAPAPAPVDPGVTESDALQSIAEGRILNDEVIDELAARAHKQCHPLENIIVDPEWRRAMVPVYVRRALSQLQAA